MLRGKYVLVAFMCILFIGSCATEDSENAPRTNSRPQETALDGYGGLVWGTPESLVVDSLHLSDADTVMDEPMKYYRKEGYMVGKMWVHEFKAGFFDGKFASLSMQSATNGILLLSTDPYSGSISDRMEYEVHNATLFSEMLDQVFGEPTNDGPGEFPFRTRSWKSNSSFREVVPCTTVTVVKSGVLVDKYLRFSMYSVELLRDAVATRDSVLHQAEIERLAREWEKRAKAKADDSEKVLSGARAFGK